MIWLTPVLAVTNSEPEVAASTVNCLLKCQWTGVPLSICRMAVTALPVMRSWWWLVSS